MSAELFFLILIWMGGFATWLDKPGKPSWPIKVLAAFLWPLGIGVALGDWAYEAAARERSRES